MSVERIKLIFIAMYARVTIEGRGKLYVQTPLQSVLMLDINEIPCLHLAAYRYSKDNSELAV